MENRTEFIKVRVSPQERARFTETLRAHGLELSHEIRAFLERKVKRLEKKGAAE